MLLPGTKTDVQLEQEGIGSHPRYSPTRPCPCPCPCPCACDRDRDHDIRGTEKGHAGHVTRQDVPS
eukprot:381658-Rhodomonas_salina.1